MTALNREMILSAKKDLKLEKVEVPEWGGHVFVATVSAAEWMAMQDEARAARDGGGKQSNAEWTGGVLARTVVDETGARIFEDRDVPELMKYPLAVINRLFMAADKLNDFSGRGVEAAEKNSRAGDGEDSPTPSPEN